ncbi:RING finger protein 141-like [Tubulanus polymorphus]|uniref:RING finger protein 141-like n=1 Tax=Tubulanus polymorphus TaxID=672921 RepID=UPI003DA2BE60
MGQENSQIRRIAPTQLVVLAEKLHHQADTLRQVATLTYEQFLMSVEELNQIIESFCESSEQQLLIAVKKGSDDSIIWKGTVRIHCLKVDKDTGVVRNKRVLNLRQYIRLHEEISRQAQSVTSDPEQKTLDTSTLLAEIAEETESRCISLEAEDSECCICMERQATVVLTCDHKYCEQCFDQWNTSHKSCPFCRKAVDSTIDTWVLTDKPDSNEMVTGVQDYLMGITEQTRDDDDAGNSNG